MMRRSAAMSALCLLVLSSSALAGSAPAELSCVPSGKVTIKGQIPSPSSEEMALTLDYMKTRLTFNSNKTPAMSSRISRWACSRW